MSIKNLFFDGAVVEFWHSDENRPFAIFQEVDKMIVDESKIEVYNRDYSYPIATIVEYDFWRSEEE